MEAALDNNGVKGSNVIIKKSSTMASSFDKGETIALSLSYHNKSIIRFISSVITKILARNNMIYLQDTIITILREIIVNAVKANSKRLYFSLENLDIFDDEQYIHGMEGFKDFIITNQEKVQDELIKSDFKVILFLKKFDSGFRIYVQNNAPIHPDELKRINDRIRKAKKYNDFSEVYCDVTDDTEGEGLGLVLTMLFLRNSGIGVNSLDIRSNERMTQTSLTVPFQLKPSAIVNKIQQQILDEVDSLPTFPENILELDNLCKNKNVDLNLIAHRISMDPSLAASILKLSNSAAFIGRKRIETIHEAVARIGLKNLRVIIIASSARGILDNRYSSFRQIWDHCNKTAYYAQQVAINNGLHSISQNVYLAGLLHDLGKIVLLSASSALSEWIFTLSRSRGMRSSTAIEEISLGVSHSTIGEKISKKWNLPEYLVEAIAFHHAPLSGKKELQDIVFITYLADKLCNIEDKKSDFYYLEEEVLDRYNINNELLFEKFHKELNDSYSSQEKIIKQ
jgi:HD-like signal output (HDOD) protein